jgi:hypothetical protein
VRAPTFKGMIYTRGVWVEPSAPKLNTQSPQVARGFSSDKPHEQPVYRRRRARGTSMTEHGMGSFLWGWSYTSFSFHLSMDLGRLCGPVPATLERPLEYAVKGPKPIPRREDIGQFRFDETLRNLGDTWGRSSGACGLCGGLSDLLDRTNYYPRNGMARRLRPRHGQVGSQLLRWGMEGVS